jgi:hypothetical protein
MPEFILDTGNGVAFRALDSFTQGYIKAAFFTSTGPDNESEGLGAASVDDIAPASLAGVVADCCKWQADNAALLELAFERDDYSPEQAGRDYWYTRNGHGVGFWDRKQLAADSEEYEALTAIMIANVDNRDVWGAALAKRNVLESIGDKLSAACRYGEVNLVCGDDGLIYFE